MNDCSMTFQNISARHALGGDVKKHVHFQRGKIRSHGRKYFNILPLVYKYFPRCAQKILTKNRVSKCNVFKFNEPSKHLANVCKENVNFAN